MSSKKDIFRKNCLSKMQKTSKHNKIYRDLIINKKLLLELKKVKNKKILFYYPFKFEADIRKSLNFLRKKNTIYTPFMQLQSFKMVPFRLPLKKKRFGILEAGNTIKNINKIDIAIVPVVGIDANLQRVGFGKVCMTVSSQN